MEEIEKQTDGQWKPGPGSIYPLLTWLQDQGCTERMPAEGGMKHYMLIEKSKWFPEEQTKLNRSRRTKHRSFSEAKDPP